MITVPCMGHCARPFDGLAACGCSAERFVRFVVMICTKGFPIEDIELLIRERFLLHERPLDEIVYSFWKK
jgi:hypothetical protein